MRKKSSVARKFGKLLEEGWQAGSSNTFADLGLKNAGELQAKAYLRALIFARIRELGLSQVQAARRTHLPQPKISRLMNETSARGFSSDKLMEIATKLGLDIQIRVKESKSTNGRVIVEADTSAPSAPKE